MMWSAPDTDNMLATNLAEIGARLCVGGNRSLQSHGISGPASTAEALKIHARPFDKMTAVISQH